VSSQRLDAEEQSAGRTLVAEDIVTGYGNQESIHEVSVRSHDGVTCIFGPNGSGKSTLMKSMAGIIPIWSGQLTFGGTDITGYGPNDAVEDGIIMLSQDGGLFESLTVRENLLLGGYTVDDKSKVRDRVEEVLDVFPALEEHYDQKAGVLSGGQQMMLSFGRAMIPDIDVYLLDEPSAGLAPSLIDDVLEQIELLVEEDAQVVLIEQNIHTALRIADHVYILAQGQLQFDGKPGELEDEDELIELYLGIE